MTALRSASVEFAEKWDEHHVAVRRTDRKTIVHPAVGFVEVDCEKLLAPESDQWLLVLTPQPGTDAADRLRLLQVIGLQELQEAQAGAAGTTGPQTRVRHVAGSGSAPGSLR